MANNTKTRVLDGSNGDIDTSATTFYDAFTVEINVKPVAKEGSPLSEALLRQLREGSSNPANNVKGGKQAKKKVKA